MKSLTPVLTSVLLAAGCAVNPPPQGSSPSPSSITEVSIRSHMQFLASDALNGRGSGTRDEWIAASYLGAQLQQWGLEPLGDSGFVQEIGIERPETASPPALLVDGRKFTHGQEMRVQSLSAARVSGPLQKYAPGTPVKAGAALLMPATPPPGASATGGKPAPGQPAPPVTTGSAIVLTLESPSLPKPPAGARLPAVPARIV